MVGAGRTACAGACRTAGAGAIFCTGAGAVCSSSDTATNFTFFAFKRWVASKRETELKYSIKGLSTTLSLIVYPRPGVSA